jgi:hypothetical protein
MNQADLCYDGLGPGGRESPGLELASVKERSLPNRSYVPVTGCSRRGSAIGLDRRLMSGGQLRSLRVRRQVSASPLARAYGASAVSWWRTPAGPPQVHLCYAGRTTRERGSI